MEYKKPTKLNPFPHIKVGMFYIKEIENEKYPQMVEIYKTPKWGSALKNKKYLTPHHAYRMIDLLDTEYKLERLKPQAKADLMGLGLVNDNE